MKYLNDHNEEAREVMRITRTGIWVNPDITVNEAAKAVLKSIDENIKFLVQRAVEDEREACLKEIAIELDEWGWGNNANIALNNVAANIRARSEK